MHESSLYAAQTYLDVIELHHIFTFISSIPCVLLEVGCFFQFHVLVLKQVLKSTLRQSETITVTVGLWNLQIIFNTTRNSGNKWSIEKQMSRQESERQTGIERTRWLRVRGSYIYVLIDVIILVLNKRLRDKPAKDWGERKEGDVFRNTEKHESKSRNTLISLWDWMEMLLKCEKGDQIFEAFFSGFTYLGLCTTPFLSQRRQESS